MEKTRTLLTEKIRESLVSVLPIIAIVTVLCLFLVPMQPNLLLTFLIGALMIVVGLGLFSLGAERSMTIIGNKIGTALTKIGKLPVILLVAFALGVGPKLLPIVPAIAVGNAALAALICLFARKNLSPARRAAATAVAAAGKFALLYLLVVQLLCRVLTLNEKQIAAFSAMFSWPQLVTALIGAAVAMCVAPVIQKALGRE